MGYAPSFSTGSCEGPLRISVATRAVEVVVYFLRVPPEFQVAPRLPIRPIRTLEGVGRSSYDLQDQTAPVDRAFPLRQQRRFVFVDGVDLVPSVALCPQLAR